MDLNKAVPTLFAYCEKLIWKIFLKFKQGTCPWMAFAWNFFGIFMIFLGGSVGQIIYREYIVFRGSNISCSPATSDRPTGNRHVDIFVVISDFSLVSHKGVSSVCPKI